MKKIIILFVVVAALAAGLFVFHSERKNHLVPAALLPEDVLVCLNQKDFGRLFDEFRKSRLGKTLGQIDLLQMAKDMEMPERNRAFLKTTLDEAAGFLNSPVFQEVFNKDVTLALLPFEASAAPKPEEHLLIVARPEHGARLIDLLATGFVKVQGQTSEQYGPYSIKHFQLEKEKVLVAVAIQDLVVMAYDQRLLHDCLDRYDKKKRSLYDNDGFQKLTAALKDPSSFYYIGLDSLKKQLEVLLEKAEGQQQALIRDELRKWNGLQAAGYGVWRENHTIRNKGIVLIDGEKFDPALKALFGTASEKNGTLTMAPEHVLAYYWTNTMDFKAYGKMYRQSAGNTQAQATRTRGPAKKTLNPDIETFLGLLDTQCGLMIRNGDAKRFLPVPDFSVFVRLKDNSRALGLVRDYLQKNAIQVREQDYKGITVNSLPGLSQGGLTPVFAVHEHYLLAASSPGMLQEIIDTLRGGQSLAGSPGFLKVSQGLLDENNSVGYIRTGELMQVLKGLVGWGRAIVVLQDRANANKAEIVIDRLVNPLLDGLAMYSDFGLRSRMFPDRILIESTTAITQ